MWNVTRDEAVEMYARFWTARHGKSAGALARKTAHSLENAGDVEGQKIWNEVAGAVERRLQDKSEAVH